MSTVLITVNGPDRPGLTGVLFTALSAHRVEVLDIDQAVIRGALTLGVLVRTPGDPEALQEHVEQAMASVGTTVRVAIDPPGADQRRSATHALVVLGRPLQARAIGALARALGEAGVNIETIRRVADYPVTGLELSVTARDDDVLRLSVARVAAAEGVDIAVQRAGLARRAKRLIVFDVDSTLITGEVIDLLAERTGTGAEVERITAAAMRGELDFAESLRRRVAMLAGLDAAVLDEVAAELELTPGARTTIRTLKRLGYRCGIVSGGFTQVARHLVDELDLDFVAANTLEVVDGRLTGGLVGDVVDRPGKARALERFAAASGVPLDQTVAVGDGANDIDMLTTAGLGVAFNAKPIVADAADTALNQPFLDPVLFILGITRDEVEAADAAEGRLRRVPLAAPAGR
ncbi:phosphoserine phosphatase SerB [Nakamurella endophytica]|uniref:phosphoserine phosphatase n=1 Tax=Nakamurella endophytica TaxID=1748367 RepID=A0A917T3U2_9ACTN|nr:phosphoserine phosphatase SerB [Nakamurella endophytica]GGM07372.1 phosphoserine phosphatase SerB [Nakamurella endophytica]